MTKQVYETFENMPDMPDGTFEKIQQSFPVYLWYENQNQRGYRRFVCTSCGKTFYTGQLMRTEGPNDRILATGRHKSIARCPLCQAEGQMRNTKQCKPSGADAQRFIVFALPVSPTDIWFRCFHIVRSYSYNNRIPVLPGITHKYEYFRYHLTPGCAYMYEYGNDFTDCTKATPNRTLREPFTWNHGIYTEKHEYECIWLPLNEVENMSQSFLRYNGIESYRCIRAQDGGSWYQENVPYIKYLCWYAKHPQLEMLAKMSHYQTIEQLIFKNSDLKRYIDWSAKKPQDLYRVDGQVYRELTKNRVGFDFELYRLFKHLHGQTLKDLSECRAARDLSNRVSRCYGHSDKVTQIINHCNRYKIKPSQFAAYIEKQAVRAQMMDYEIYGEWDDYIRMSGSKGQNMPFPTDLHAEHQKAIAKQQQARAAEAIEAQKKRIDGLYASYPELKANLEEIKPIFGYSDSDYTIRIPDGIEDILAEGTYLKHCVGEKERYYERINQKESYILFLRKTADIDTPWYTLEVEPDGTVRQKRTFEDRQNDDLDACIDFLRRWQEAVKARLTDRQRELAAVSRKKRRDEFDELRRTHATIRYGVLAGALLVDILEADLLEAN